MDRTSEKIGGPEVIVHVDETAITSKKYGKGKSTPSNTVWVVGGVDINSRKLFLKFLPSKSTEDLMRFLCKYVESGSIVHTDSLPSYNAMVKCGFTHFKVNHSTGFKSPKGIHTNWIEGIFGSLKKLRRKYDTNWTNADDLSYALSEYCFRYSHQVWDRRYAFLKILAVLRYVKIELDKEDHEQ